MSVLTLIKNSEKFNIAFNGTPNLRELLEETGYAVFSPCGGKGTCGKCAVRLSGSVSEPNKNELSAGVRLACQTVLLGDAAAELLIDDSADAKIETGTVTPSVSNQCSWEYGAAVDIGTTTVVLKLFDTDGECVGEASMLNPQRTVSADVIGRIDAALRGKADLLKKQIADCIKSLLSTACRSVGITPNEVESFVLTGNTAMLYLLTCRSPESIARAPFKSETLFGEWVDKAYLPPCMNAFVGADITCAVLASGMCSSADTALLCDIGTNGEIALWKEGRLFITSTAAGPAFEGAEIENGCGSISGAIDRVWVENGKLCVRTIDDKPAVGICGSGLVSAVAAFLELGCIDETGAIEDDEDALALSANGNTVYLTQGDIRAVQLAKSAIAAGIETVLRRSNTDESEIKTLYLAGGFGNHLSMESAARIGLIPESLSRCAKPIGNAALSGAVMLLFDENEIKYAEHIASNSTHIDLGGSGDFNNAFIENIYFPEN